MLVAIKTADCIQSVTIRTSLGLTLPANVGSMKTLAGVIKGRPSAHVSAAIRCTAITSVPGSAPPGTSGPPAGAKVVASAGFHPAEVLPGRGGGGEGLSPIPGPPYSKTETRGESG